MYFLLRNLKHCIGSFFAKMRKNDIPTLSNIEITEKFESSTFEETATKGFTPSSTFGSQEDPPRILDFDFWSNIVTHLEIWQHCDLILACPLTFDSAKTLFPDKAVYLMENMQGLHQFYWQYKKVKFKAIGIISPYFLNDLLKNDAWLIKLMRLCAQMMIGAGSNSRQFHSKLHKIGFYYIEALFNDVKSNYLTEGIMPDGQHSFFYSHLSKNDTHESMTFVAYRMKHHNIGDKYHWKNTVGTLTLLADNSISGETNKLSICAKDSPYSNLENITSCLISGTLTWNTQNSGHASLISCYHGPSDATMYALLAEISNSETIYLSVWKHDDVWSCLEKTLFSSIGFSQSSHKSAVSIWLKTTTDGTITAGAENQLLFTINDGSIARNNIMGLRILGNAFSFSNIQTEYLTRSEHE